MAEEFLSYDLNSSTTPPANPPSHSNTEPIRLILVGSKPGITRTIHWLYTRGIAPTTAWSKLQPEPQTGQWMSILTKSMPR